MIGLRLWFPVCNAMEDKIMSCHWAGEALWAVSILLLILAVLHVFLPDRGIKTGIDLSIIMISIFAMRVPGGIINICKDDSMHCHKTLLWTCVFGAVISILSLLDVIFWASKASKEKHKRSGNREAA